MNDVWRFDIKIGALLADNKFLDNAGGWGIYQNEVRGDTIIPYHCEGPTLDREIRGLLICWVSRLRFNVGNILWTTMPSCI